MTDAVQGAPEGAPVEEQQIPQRPDNIPEKFWNAETGAVNTEALLASYTELEKKASKPEGEGEQQPVENQEQQIPTPTNTEAYNAAVEKASAELASETGVISEETYVELEATGVTRAQVDTYVEGQIAMQELRKIHIERDVGGEQAYADMLAWAGANYSPEDADAYNTAAFGASREAAITAARALKAKYEDAMGTEGKIVTSGTGGNAPGGYANKTEWMSDIRKPEYKKDAAFRESVRVKLETSLKNGVDMGVGVSAG